MNNQVSRRTRISSRRRRLGYTLLEIMTAVTLALMLMYAVARIFSRVGGQMNETMSTMEMTNALRNAKHRLTADLENLTVTPEAPRNSLLNEGFLYYAEGMGGPFARVAAKMNQSPDESPGFATSDIALDTERMEAYYADYGSDEGADTTVGDLDDVLSFTAKAPANAPFRGRYIKPIYSFDGYIRDGEIATFESQYAEIIWFVRGTTLYRRVLPLMPRDELQDSLIALQCAATGYDQRGNANSHDSELSGVSWQNIKMGYGFFYFYDVSVHLGKGDTVSDASGTRDRSFVVANTLADLTNRENRYFYWNSCGLHLHPDNDSIGLTPAPLHGVNDAWYWLRMPTLQESVLPNFRAGAPFGQDYFARDSWINRKVDGRTYLNYARQLLGSNGESYSTDEEPTDYWPGATQGLTFDTEGIGNLGAKTYTAADLPIQGSPFIDYWNRPNVWNELNYETGDLRISNVVVNPDFGEKIFNQDVILTNVISFNVKVWDDNCKAYVDLGSCAGQPDPVKPGSIVSANDPADFRSLGFYAEKNQGTNKQVNNSDIFPWLPAVYDTWTEQYQRDLYYYDDYMLSQATQDNPYTCLATGSLSNIETNNTISASQLENLPPPYTQRVKGLQIELRVFDPRSKHIRNATFCVDLTDL